MGYSLAQLHRDYKGVLLLEFSHSCVIAVSLQMVKTAVLHKSSLCFLSCLAVISQPHDGDGDDDYHGDADVEWRVVMMLMMLLMTMMMMTMCERCPDFLPIFMRLLSIIPWVSHDTSGTYPNLMFYNLNPILLLWFPEALNP